MAASTRLVVYLFHGVVPSVCVCVCVYVYLHACRRAVGVSRVD